MKISTLLSNKTKIYPIVFWLFVWEIFSRIVGEEILLVSPISAISRVLELIFEKGFFSIVFLSLSKITLGFLIAVILGIVFATLAYNKKIIKELIEPLILVIQTVPVASFIILSLIWIDSKNLSIFISFLMVYPIIYRNVLKGLKSTDKELLEMAKVFNVKRQKKVRYIYIQSIKPFLETACFISLGLCWKAGIAAEVIGLPKGTLGEMLYEAKIYIYTRDLFAWTIVIVLVSVLFQKIFLKGLKEIFKRLE